MGFNVVVVGVNVGICVGRREGVVVGSDVTGLLLGESVGSEVTGLDDGLLLGA